MLQRHLNFFLHIEDETVSHLVQSHTAEVDLDSSGSEQEVGTQGRVFLHNPGCPGTHYVHQDGIELTEIHKCLP